MKKFNSAYLKKWEISMLLALCVTLCAGAWAQARSAALAGRLIRLHVIAASDTEEEQAVKLTVRDAVLECLAPRLEGAEDPESARAVVSASLAEVEAAARAVSGGRTVTVTLSPELYPTREYEGFALPAGRYQSLRVVLGEGAGRNWWCVVFPPLCLTAAEAQEAMSALPESDARLISDDAEGVVIRFRLLELWGELLARLGA